MNKTIEQRVVELRKASTIEERAYELHLSIWNARKESFRGSQDPVDFLDPGVALDFLGFKVVTDPCLGEMVDGGRKVRVAGLIDRDRMIVRISPIPTFQEQRFTTAHELAHAVLHPGMTGLHHDKVVSGPSHRKDKLEAQADAFASSFLMPARRLIKNFEQFFGPGCFRLTEDSIYGLQIRSVDQALHRFRCTRDISMAVATATTFMGRPFTSLAASFRVSPTAMAIRLEEVGLIEDFSERRVR